MKKAVSLLLILSLLCTLFTGCGSEEEEAYVPTGDAIVLDGMEPDDFVEEEVEVQKVTLAYNPDRSLNPLIGFSSL